MRKINDALTQLATNNDPATVDTEAELTDELMSLDMGLQVFRRAMAKKARKLRTEMRRMSRQRLET